MFIVYFCKFSFPIWVSPIKLLPTLDPLTLFLSKTPMTLTTNKSVIISQNSFFGPVSGNKHVTSAMLFLTQNTTFLTLNRSILWLLCFLGSLLFISDQHWCHQGSGLGHTLVNIYTHSLDDLLPLSFIYMLMILNSHLLHLDLFWSPRQGHFKLAYLKLRSWQSFLFLPLPQTLYFSWSLSQQRASHPSIFCHLPSLIIHSKSTPLAPHLKHIQHQLDFYHTVWIMTTF